MDISMYDTLNAIPLFQGLNGIDLNRIFDRVQLTIECLNRGDTLFRQGELCRQMAILLDGTLQAETVSPDGTYTIREQVERVTTLECDILYGIQREWSSTYTANDECRLMLIPKDDVSRMLGALEVFRLNYINAVCTLAARRRRQAWKDPSPTLRERLVQFILSHTQCHKGPLQMAIRMQDLGAHLGTTRSLVSATLRRMQDEGMLTLSRRHIDIHDISDLR